MAAFLPLALQILSLALKWYGNKQDTLDAFEKLIEASHDDGLISAKTKDVFLEQKAQLQKDLVVQKPG